MSEQQNEALTFHNQDAVLRIALWANVIAWAVLVLYLINFANDISSIVQNWPIQMPPGFVGKLMAYAGILSKPVFGLMYFLALEGVSQLLYLGADIFFGKEEIEIIEVTEAE